MRTLEEVLDSFGLENNSRNLEGVNFPVAADLSNTNLRNVSFRSQSMQSINFEQSNLWGSDFSYSFISECNFRGADLRHCVFNRTEMTEVSLQGAKLPTTLVVPALCTRILERITRDPRAFDMQNWKTCLGGYAVQEAGEAGRVLAELWSISVAASIIFASTYPNDDVPDFYMSREEAVDYLRNKVLAE